MSSKEQTRSTVSNQRRWPRRGQRRAAELPNRSLHHRDMAMEEEFRCPYPFAILGCSLIRCLFQLNTEGRISVAKVSASIDDLGVSTIQLTNEEKLLTIKRNIGEEIIMSEKRLRVLLAKGGLDAHDTGVKVVASALRDAGMEVIYLGLRQSPESIVETAIQEDADIIGISSLSGSLIPMARRLMGLVREKHLRIPVIYGGTILKGDREELLNMGVKETFAPGASLREIVEKVKQLAGQGAAG